MAGLTVSLAETRAAQAFLKLLGVGTTDPSIIASVVAWYKVSLATAGWKDNPFGIEAGTYDKAYRSGVREHKIFVRYDEDRNPVYRYEYTSVYSSMTAALQGIASYFLADRAKFGAIQKALALGRVDLFYTALMQTDLDPKHYIDAKGRQRLYDELAKYSSVILNPPPKPVPQPATTSQPSPMPAPPPRPKQPRNLIHRAPPTDYLQPGAARTFYEARRPRLDDVVGEPLRSAL